MQTKIKVKPLIEYEVTFITGQTQTFTSINAAIGVIERMIKHNIDDTNAYKKQLLRLETSLPILEKELTQLKEYKVKNDRN